MAEQNTTAANSTISLSQNLDKMIAGGLRDYNSWKSLILEIEKAPPEDINTVSLAYDSFLLKFPLCHWHLEKYAYQKAKFCNSQEAVNIYERAVEVAKFSVGFWADYFTFAAASFESPVDIRRLFERAISFVGRDYFCHVLWDKYMKYEFNQEGWHFLAQSYIWALRFPTKKLRFYYDNFKQFVANLEEEIGYESYDKNDSIVQQLSVPCVAIELSKDETSLVIKDMLDSFNGPLKSEALDRYRSIGDKFYLEARQMDEKIKRFETKIQRQYFDVTPLDDDQLNNWHLYLDFIEKQDNLDWAMKLYERCLIPCANYPEFWMRYVEFLESKGGRELAISALARATQIFLKTVPEIHLFDARFKEHIGDANGARAALTLCDPKTDSSFIESIDAQANLERRLGNLGAASATYEKALKEARERRKLHVLPSLYCHFSRLRFLITGNAAASRDVLIEGIRQVPHCIFLLEELMKFAMTHEGESHVNIIDSIIADAIFPGLDENEGLDANDRENISCLFLEPALVGKWRDYLYYIGNSSNRNPIDFVNLCGTMHDIRKAWNRHVKLFPQTLRMKTAYNHPTSGNHPIGLAGDKKGNRRDQHHGQEQLPELPANNEVRPGQVVRELMPLKDQSNDVKGNVQVLLTKEVLSNGDESQDCEPAHEVSDGQGPMVVSVEFPDHAKENALTVRDSDQGSSYQSRGDEPGPMDISAGLGVQSKEDASEPPRSAHDVGKSTETTESIEAYHSSLTCVQPALDCEFNQTKHSVPFDHDSVKSQEKESQELIPMSCDEYETMRTVQVVSMTPKIIHPVESLKARSESERDGSVSYQHNTPSEGHTDPEEPSITCHEDSIEIDDTVPAPGHPTSRFQDRTQDRERKLQQSPYVDHHPANALNRKSVTNQGIGQQYPARGRHSQLELGAIREDKATDREQPVMYQGNAQQYPARQQHSQSERAIQEDKATDPDQRMGVLTPPTSMSGEQLPASSQPVSYAQQNTNPIASETTQQQWQAQQSLAMNQMMLQYHYQQQQLLQQQYQQQLHMQHPYFQMQQQYMNQQPYQVEPQQQNQQQHVQQQQQQSSQQHHQHLQTQQGHEPHPNFQQVNDKQYQPSQDIAYQQQLAYQQHASQEQQQQLLWQQYQQYQGYQLLQQQQQLKEGSTSTQGHHMHQHPSQRQQDEQLQQHHQQAHSQQKFTQNMSQNRQGSTRSTPDYDPGRPSESPRLGVHSPRAMQ